MWTSLWTVLLLALQEPPSPAGEVDEAALAALEQAGRQLADASGYAARVSGRQLPPQNRAAPHEPRAALPVELTLEREGEKPVHLTAPVHEAFRAGLKVAWRPADDPTWRLWVKGTGPDEEAEGWPLLVADLPLPHALLPKVGLLLESLHRVEEEGTEGGVLEGVLKPGPVASTRVKLRARLGPSGQLQSLELVALPAEEAADDAADLELLYVLEHVGAVTVEVPEEVKTLLGEPTQGAADGARAPGG